MRRRLLLLLLIALPGCTANSPVPPGALPFTKVEPGKTDSSAEAIFLDFTFEGELLTDRGWSPEAQIQNQLLYTIGQLNGSRAVGRLDRVEISDVASAPVEGGFRVTYTARLPVAWGRRADVPTEYTLRLPRDITFDALDRFAENYGHACVSAGAHDVTSGSMWYYYRPERRGCEIAVEDLVTPIATVELSDINTTGRFPEYHRVWEDEELRVIAVFGKYEDGATSADAGINAYNSFVSELGRRLGRWDLTTEPAEVPRNPGVDVPEVIFRATLDENHAVEVVALLVDNVRTAGAQFDERYAQLTPDADLIIYNGHAGLGANIRALARKGRWRTGQYSIVFMNGCDTYAYVDRALWDARAEVNPDDPSGTRFLDIVSNALPSYFRSMPMATLALIDGLMSYAEPQTYEQIFAAVDSSQVVLVSGEQDNEFTPGGGEPVPVWEGLSAQGELALGEEARFETPVLPSGAYRFEMTGTGDADLYVRIGGEPSTVRFDCRPYLNTSHETCVVELASEALIHVLVLGASAEGARFELTGTTS